MITELYLKALRRKLSEVDQATSDITDPELLDASEDARRQLAVRKVPGFGTLTIVSAQNQPGYGILPEMTDEVGQVLLLKTAVDMLQQTYVGRLSRGELGMSWTSGMESESTISAEKAYQGMIRGIQSELDELSLIRNSALAGFRAQ